MATTVTPSTPPIFDIVRRGIKRALPCKLTDAEFMQIAKQRVDKEALLDQIEADFNKLKTKHKTQVEELADEIGKARKELHSGEQDRTVLCTEIFERAEDGTGWVVTLRTDTTEAVERRPATISEAQRYLPGVESGAAGSSGSAQGTSAGGEDAEPDDDGLTELTPAQIAAKESKAARKARRGAKGKSAKIQKGDK